MKKHLSKYSFLFFLFFNLTFFVSHSQLIAQSSNGENFSYQTSNPNESSWNKDSVQNAEFIDQLVLEKDKKQIREQILGFQPVETVSIFVNLPATQLELYINKKLYKTYPIAIGMGKYPTPIQEFNISQIVWNPWWLPPDSDWAKDAEKTPPGPNNPLGPVKMLMENGVRIHGTNKPRSIGHAASHACIRMHSKDAKELAWEIQKRYSEKNDESLLSTYTKKREQSFYINLQQAIPVTVTYKQVVLNDSQLIIYPDFYGRGGFQKDLEIALSEHAEIVVDRSLVQKLNKLRRKGKVEINLNELAELKTNTNEMKVVTKK